MPSWKFDRGEDAIHEGTVSVATHPSATLSTYNLAGATMFFAFGSVLGTAIATWDSASGTNFAFGTAAGTFTFSIFSDDTNQLPATSYYYSYWLRTSGGREYHLELGTLVLKPTVNTI